MLSANLPIPKPARVVIPASIAGVTRNAWRTPAQAFSRRGRHSWRHSSSPKPPEQVAPNRRADLFSTFDPLEEIPYA
jgi:hypothetical protein